MIEELTKPHNIHKLLQKINRNRDKDYNFPSIRQRFFDFSLKTTKFREILKKKPQLASFFEEDAVFRRNRVLNLEKPGFSAENSVSLREPSILAISRPFFVQSRREINKTAYLRQEISSVSQKNSEKSAYFLENSEFPARKPRNFVKTHQLGFENTANDDFFKHFFRIFLRELAFSQENARDFEQFFAKIREIRDNRLNSQKKLEEQREILSKTAKTFAESPEKLQKLQEMQEIALPFELKAFLIKKTRLDLRLFEKIFNLFAKSRENQENREVFAKKSSVSASFSAKKFFREDVFVENFLEKARKHGVSRLGFEEIENFREIIEKRRVLLQKLEDSLIVQGFLRDSQGKNSNKRNNFSDFLPEMLASAQGKADNLLVEFYKENGEATAKTAKTEKSIGKTRALYRGATFRRENAEKREEIAEFVGNKANLFEKGSVHDKKLFRRFLKEKLRFNREILKEIREKNQENPENFADFRSKIEESDEDFSMEIASNSNNSSEIFEEKLENTQKPAISQQDREKIRRIEEKLKKNAIFSDFSQKNAEKPSFFNSNFAKTANISKSELRTQENLPVIKNIERKNIEKSREIAKNANNSSNHDKSLNNLLSFHGEKSQKIEEIEEKSEIFDSNSGINLNIDAKILKNNENFKISKEKPAKIMQEKPKFDKVLLKSEEKTNFQQEKLQFSIAKIEKEVNKTQLFSIESSKKPFINISDSNFIDKHAAVAVAKTQEKNVEISENCNNNFNFIDNLVPIIKKTSQNQDFSTNSNKNFNNILTNNEANPSILMQKSLDIAKTHTAAKDNFQINVRKSAFSKLETPSFSTNSTIIRKSVIIQKKQANQASTKNSKQEKSSESENYSKNEDFKKKTAADSRKASSIFETEKNQQKPQDSLRKSMHFSEKLSKKPRKSSIPAKMVQSKIKEEQAIPSNLQEIEEESQLQILNIASTKDIPLQKPANSEPTNPINPKSAVSRKDFSKENSKDQDFSLDLDKELEQAVESVSKHEKLLRKSTLSQNTEPLERPSKLRPSNSIAIPDILPLPISINNAEKDQQFLNKKPNILEKYEEEEDLYANIEITEDPDLKISEVLSLDKKLLKKTTFLQEDLENQAISILRRKMERFEESESPQNKRPENFSNNNEISANSKPSLSDFHSPLLKKDEKIAKIPENDAEQKRRTSKIVEKSEPSSSSLKKTAKNESESPKSPKKKDSIFSGIGLKQGTAATIKQKLSIFCDDVEENTGKHAEIEINLKTLKENIEENLNSLNEEKDSDAKYTLIIYNQRKEQMNRLLQQIESNIEENILTESDCNDQLRVFLEMRSRFSKENEKNNKFVNSLKFCNQIAVPSSDHISNTILLDSELSSHENANIDNFAKFFALNQDLFNEQQRKKLFARQQKMLSLLRKFLNRYKSRVKQKNCGNSVKNDKIPQNYTEGSLLCEVTRLEQTNIRKIQTEADENQKNLSCFERNYNKYYNSLKKLKETDKKEFASLVTKLKNVKGKVQVGKFLKEI